MALNILFFPSSLDSGLGFRVKTRISSSFLLLPSLELSDNRVYEPYIPAAYRVVLDVEAEVVVEHVQGYLAHEKHPLPRTLQQDYN